MSQISFEKKIEARTRFSAARITYNYCGICGHVPKADDEPNRAPLRFWDPDDGWKIGSLCFGCAEDALTRQPQTEDYAFRTTNQVADAVDTDEDAAEAL